MISIFYIKKEILNSASLLELIIKLSQGIMFLYFDSSWWSMYNNITQECTCRCGTKWQARTGKIPVKCPKCGSRLWNSEVKTYSSVICRAGTEDPRTGYREFCFLDYIDQPSVVSSDLFYISKDDMNKYLSIHREIT